mmetsp:Transcript_10143/g.15567  ORF Transcript_10143/g.15567 Transcript_10143/m.15567 type:complete len:895 (+) Transcript_10143:59-2743(+)
MGGLISTFLTDNIFVPLAEGILILYDILPYSSWFTYVFFPTGLIHLLVHRYVLDKRNLYKASFKPIPEGYKQPTEPLPGRTDDGFGTDIKNPTTAMTGAPIGRNMVGLPKHLRDPHGKPDVQMVAQRLLAREGFKPAADQFNILAASWIQAMVHDWIGHFDGDDKVTLDKGAKNGCPFASFSFKNTKVRDDGNFESERSQWWDASFLYGNNVDQVKEARTFEGGKMKTSGKDHVLPERKDGTYLLGDNKNSWVGVALLQELFLKEHNWIADKMASAYPDMTDQQLFDAARLVIAALVAKIHTVDWTVELLKTPLLRIGLETNWYGLPKALFGRKFPLTLLSQIQQKKGADNKGTPFCLTEEFAAVYRLHSLSPPGLIVGKNNEYIPLLDCLGDKGREVFKKSPELPKELMKSCLSYPCGNLASSNYPNDLREFAPTDDTGLDLPKEDHIDLAPLDLFRDRERGIRKFNDFRRALNLKPYRTWMELTNNKDDARKLELIYGPGQAGIEKLDLLVGDMYEKKPPPGPDGIFILSETSFVIFLLMASRRLGSDPYLNEYMTEKYYTEIGLQHIEETEGGLFDLLNRHYPDLAKDFKDKNGKQKHSVFKPTFKPEVWEKAIDEGVVPKSVSNIWAETKKANEKFFKDLEEESRSFYKNWKSNSSPPVSTQNIYIILSVLLFVIPFYLHQAYSDYEPLRQIGIRKVIPVSMDIARELAYSNCRHVDSFLRLYHLPTNPLIFASQVYLMDKTPKLATLPFGINLNFGGIYYIFLTLYGLFADLYTGIICAVWLTLFYKLGTNGSYDNWLTRLVGEETKLRTAFGMYCFCQFSQIIVHNIFENYYDWNLFQLFIIQQHITVYNIINVTGIYPSFSEGVAYWLPIFQACLYEGSNHPIDCGL